MFVWPASDTEGSVKRVHSSVGIILIATCAGAKSLICYYRKSPDERTKYSRKEAFHARPKGPGSYNQIRGLSGPT
jgi:hypothetical protein